MKKFIVTFDVPDHEEFVVVCVEASEKAEAIARAAIKLDDGGDDVWTLVSVEPVLSLCN